jgi:glycosyltransferase involved in cell wall biosynthesis
LNNNYPLVTVFTLIYNTNPKFVIEAIESVRANNYPNLQHIIIDDCSPNPGPKKVVQEWIKKENYSCEFYEHEVNYGVCKTLNHVLELAKGKYIFGCSDDLILSDKIITEVEILEKLNDTYAATYSDATLIDEQNNPLYGLFIQKYRSFHRLPEGNVYNILLEGNFLPVMAMLWKTDVIREVGGYDENLSYEDFDLHLRIFKKYKIKLINKKLAKYRIHSDSLMNNLTDWNKDLLRIYYKHLDQRIARDKIQEIVRIVISGSTSITDLKKHYIKYPYFWFLFKKIFFFDSNIISRNILKLLQGLGLDLIRLVKIP